MKPIMLNGYMSYFSKTNTWKIFRVENILYELMIEWDNMDYLNMIVPTPNLRLTIYNILK